MLKKLFCIFLTAFLLLGMAVPAMAVKRNQAYILDECDGMAISDENFFQFMAESSSNAHEMDILYVLTERTDLKTYAESLKMGKRHDQIMLVDNGQTQEVFFFGKARVLTDADAQRLIDSYNSVEVLTDRPYTYLMDAGYLLEEKESTGAFKNIPEEYLITLPRLVDDANILSDAEEAQLLAKLNEISQRQQLDVVVVTISNLYGKSAMEYADDFFDYNGYGFGEEHDGILLLVCMGSRDWWISTTGYGITAFTDKGLDYISKRVVKKLTAGKYHEAFDIFADRCDQFITEARRGTPYDGAHMPKVAFPPLLCLIVSLVAGLFCAAMAVWGMSKKHQSVCFNSGAEPYKKGSSFRLTKSSSSLLYSNVTSVPDFAKIGLEVLKGAIEVGGSIVHSSSSGRSHGGRGGKF